MDGIGSTPTHWQGLLDTFRDYVAFLRNPRLPAQQLPFSRLAWSQVFKIFTINAASTAIVVAVLFAIRSTGFELPSRTRPDLDPAVLFLTAVIAAPLFEEWLFRSWLSARKFDLALGASVGGMMAMVGLTLLLFGKPNLSQFGFMAAGWAIATAFLLAPRRKDQSIWPPIKYNFHKLFWISSATVALAHLINYEEEMGMVLILMVIPQFVGGTLLGYARVTIGLWASIVLHAMHNAALVTLLLTLPE